MDEEQQALLREKYEQAWEDYIRVCKQLRALDLAEGPGLDHHDDVRYLRRGSGMRTGAEKLADESCILR